MIPLQYRALIAAGLVAGGFLVAWKWQANTYENQIADIRLQHSVASALAVQSALDEQQRRITATKEISDEGDAAIEVVAVAAAGADESVRLRNEELTGVLARTRRDLSNAATQRQADRQTIMVLTELYRSADDRANELAGRYEDARARGLTCEAMYAAMCPVE